MVAVVCPHARSYYLRAFFGAFVTVTFPYTVQYTLFTLPPPQTKIDFNFSWVEQSSREKAMLILRGIQTVSARVEFILAYHPFHQKNCLAPN